MFERLAQDTEQDAAMAFPRKFRIAANGETELVKNKRTFEILDDHLSVKLTGHLDGVRWSLDNPSGRQRDPWSDYQSNRWWFTSR